MKKKLRNPLLDAVRTRVRRLRKRLALYHSIDHPIRKTLEYKRFIATEYGKLCAYESVVKAGEKMIDREKRRQARAEREIEDLLENLAVERQRRERLEEYQKTKKK